MSSISVSLIVLACVFGGALLGMILRRIIPSDHLTGDSKDIMKQGMGLIATMAALLLGLLVAAAKSTYDAQKSEVTEMSSKLVLLDRILARYGPEAQECRAMLKAHANRVLNNLWPQDRSASPQLEPIIGDETLYIKIHDLSPKDELQRTLQAQALSLMLDLGRMHWMMFEQSGSSISFPLLTMVVLWLAVIFIGFGTFAPPNASVVVTLFVCAVAVSGAFFLILEMDKPFQGVIQIPSAPLRTAIDRMGQS